MNKFFSYIFLLVAVAAAFFYRDAIKNVVAQSINYYFPCKTTITYSIGTFDTEFGLSKTDFLSALSDAEAIWEKPIGKNLFQYKENGSMKVNLIYDTRQETTQQLNQMGIMVENNKASYDSLKTKYDSLLSSYNAQKTSFTSRVSAYEAKRKAYEAEVTTVNKKGGGDKATVTRLNTEKDALNTEGKALNQEQQDLNTAINNINAVASALNDLAKTLNIGVKQYNTIGENLGGEFDEGIYKSDSTGREIDIYQFDNQTKLVRVLAHELGHALGLDHLDDPKAIMYRLNNGVNEKLTTADLVALKNLCGIN
jgi:predicted Zn-dependent protease